MTTPPVRTSAGARLAEIDELDVTIEKLVSGGEGLARFDGVPIFVPRSAPGDRVRVRLVERRPGYGRAEIVEILEPAPERREPPCRYFERCGGCDLQHLEDDAQVRWKAAAALETLRRLGRIESPPAVRVVSGSAWGYRQRTQLQCRSGDAGVEVGYFARRSRDLVAIRECPVLAPELDAALHRLPAALPPEPPRRLDLTAGTAGALTSAPRVEGLPTGPVTIAAGGFDLELDARCFFQGHRGLLDDLVEAVVGDAAGDLACDLYAGVGLFSLPLARRYGRVMAVESDPVAARYARRNARRYGLEIEVVAQAVETWIEARPAGVDRVVVDPPRSGLAAGVCDALVAAPPSRFTYVSCHAATLARDLLRLRSVFSLESLALVDLFPQTGHLEVVAQLRTQAAEPAPD